MFQPIITFISDLLSGNRSEFILIVLVVMITFFFMITFFLFLTTIYLRLKTTSIAHRNDIRRKKWDPLILAVMEGEMEPETAYEQMRWRNSTDYLLHLELFIDMVKGKEKERLIALGRLSEEHLKSLLLSRKRKDRLFGVHLLALFNVEDKFKYLRFDVRDIEITLTTIREMRLVNDFRTKEKLIHMLFSFPHISPIYISNILVDMGRDIIPVLKMLIEERSEHPYEQIIAIETFRRMHDASGIDLTVSCLPNCQNTAVLTSSLRYIAELGDYQLIDVVKPYMAHPDQQVRLAAIEAYIELTDEITDDDIKQFFNDPSIKVAVKAAKKLQLIDSVPYVDLEEIDGFKWADVFKQMVY